MVYIVMAIVFIFSGYLIGKYLGNKELKDLRDKVNELNDKIKKLENTITYLHLKEKTGKRKKTILNEEKR